MTITDRTTEGARRVPTHELASQLRVAVARLSRRLRAEKADDALTDSQMTVLALISRHGVQTLSQLSDFERVRLPSMNRTVNSLVADGYVTREPSTDDRRKVLLEITVTGAQLVLDTRRQRDEWLHSRLAQLTPRQRRTLNEATEILTGLADS